MSRRAWAVIGGAFAAIVIVVVIVLATGDDKGSDKTTTSTTVPSTTAATAPPAPSPPTTTTPLPEGFATPEDAIADYLQDKGYEYAGDCAGTDLDTDVGKWCSGSDGGMGSPRTYFIGPTFSEGAEQLTLTQGSDGKWRVTASEPTPPVGG